MLNTFSPALIDNNIIDATFKSFQKLKQETMLLSSLNTQMIKNLQSITKPIKERSEKLTQLSQNMMKPTFELQQLLLYFLLQIIDQ